MKLITEPNTILYFRSIVAWSLSPPSSPVKTDTTCPNLFGRSWQLLIPTSPWFPLAKIRAVLLLLPPPHPHPGSPRSSRLRNGTPSLFGLGTLLLITARSVGIISWIFVLSARPIKLVQRAKSALLPGVCATMPSTFTALADG